MSPAPSKTLIKLIDLAIIPAALLIFAKIIGMLLLNAVLNLQWDVKSFSDAFFGVKLVYDSIDEQVLVISISNFFMHLAALTGAVVAILKLFYLHPDHVKPNVVLKLAKNDKLHYMQTTFHLYNEAIVWAMFLIVSDILVLLNYTQGLTYDWVFGFSIFSTLLIIFILVRTVDRDINVKNLKYK